MNTSRKSTKPETTTETGAQKFRLKVVGVGGAGGNAIAQLAGMTMLEGVELLAVNSDRQALPALDGVEPVQIGAGVTHGMGAGGDVELGARAAQQDAERLEAALMGADVVFILTGLGGGVGTGASPVVARLAKEQGAMVLAYAALPFTFEGDRRRQQALLGLEQLKQQSDAVICLPNDKLFKLLGEGAGATEAFARGNAHMAFAVQAIWQLLSRKGLINLDFADLRATLSTANGARRSDGLFSHGEAEGADRARDAVKALLENPLFDGTEVLGRAESVLVSVLGGPDMSLTDVQRAVEPISKLAGNAKVIMGAAVEESYRGKLSITVIASAQVSPRRAVPSQPVGRGSVVNISRTTGRPVTPITATPTPVAEPVAPAVKKEATKPKQADLPLAEVTRGRFDKSEPTLYDGEDLDVPTFLRRGINLSR